MTIAQRLRKLGKLDLSVAIILFLVAVYFLGMGLATVLEIYTPAEHIITGLTLLGISIAIFMFVLYFIQHMDLRRTK